ncbi:MAG: choline dehydrogenase-like flavoprotein, partial [Myxococcota bacterium]
AYREGAAFELDADYVVIGSGAGGATAALQLARGGASVCLVEAGPWRMPSDYPESMYGALRDMTDDWGAILAQGRAFWPVVQARVMGGTTTINSAIVVRTPGDIFAQWEREHGVGGDAMADAIWTYQDELEVELNVEPVPDAAMGRSNHLAVAGGKKIGIESHVLERNVKDCAGSGQCLQGCRLGHKQSTQLKWIPEVLTRGGDVLSCAPVAKLRMEGNRVIGASGRFQHPQTRKKGAPFFVRAKKAVLLAASVTHTPVILMASGIKNKSVGGYFRAHPGAAVCGVYDEAIDMNAGATQGWASIEYRKDPGIKLESLSLPAEVVASRLAGGGRALMERLTEYRQLATWVAAVRAETVGRVKSFMGKPSVKYSMDKADMHRLRYGLHAVSRMHFAMGAKRVIPGVAGMDYALTADNVDLLLDAPLDPRCYVGICTHLFGGAVMGTDKQTSVCDGKGHVHDVEGLVIADAAQIPTNLGVNPQHTIMGLARLRADELLAA